MNMPSLLFAAKLARRAPILCAAFTLAAPGVAMAGEEEMAEHRRLSEEMKKLAQRNAWAGVDRKFEALVKLQRKGEVLTFEDWYLGAQAARGLGNMADCRVRLQGALGVENNKEVVGWLEDIERNYVMVTLKSTDKENPHTLTIKGMPFAADQRAAVEAAQASVAEGRAYDGMLPVGGYVFAAGELGETFVIASGGEPVNIRLGAAAPGGREKGEEFKLAYVGPRADIGVAYTMGGAAVDGTVGPDSPAPIEGFGGAGARAAVGVEVGLTRAIGVGLQVGYHNIVGGMGTTTAMGDQAQRDDLHLGFGQLTASYRAGDLWFSAGGIYGGGVAHATDTATVSDIGVPYICSSNDAGCVELEETATVGTPMTASLLLPGFTASAGYALFDLGDTMKGAVTLSGGMLADPHRNYPWGQLAFTVAPVPSGRN